MSHELNDAEQREERLLALAVDQLGSREELMKIPARDLRLVLDTLTIYYDWLLGLTIKLEQGEQP